MASVRFLAEAIPRTKHSPCGSIPGPRPLSPIQGLINAEWAQRLAEVCKLPLIHPGWFSAPWLPSTLPGSHFLAEVDPDFPLALPVWLAYLPHGTLGSSVSLVHLLSIHSRPLDWATCSSMQATSDSFRLNQCPLAADLLRQASSFIEISRHRESLLVAVSNSRLWPLELFSPCGNTTITKTSQHHADALKSTLSDCILGKYATPDSFRPSQRPLAVTPGSQTPSIFPSVFSSFITSKERESRTSRFSSRLRRGLGPWTGFTPSRAAY